MPTVADQRRARHAGGGGGSAMTKTTTTTGRTRGLLIALAVAAALAAAEVGLNLWRGPLACVEVVNLGPDPIENLRVDNGAARAVVALVEPGGRAKVYLAGDRPGPFRLTLLQRSAERTVALPGFDPVAESRGGFKTVLRLRPDAVERSRAPDPAPLADAARRLGRSLRRSYHEALGRPPDPPDGDG